MNRCVAFMSILHTKKMINLISIFLTYKSEKGPQISVKYVKNFEEVLEKMFILTVIVDK